MKKIRQEALRIRLTRRAQKGAAVLAAAVLLVMTLPGAQAGMGGSRSETVYAVLANDGSYSGATVVNCFPNGGRITDYGSYISVTNLTGEEIPVIDGGKIEWDAEAGKPFYYQGETDKALPLSVAIRYYLDGEEADARSVAGKTGALTIEMTVRNETGTGEIYADTGRELVAPLAVQVSLSLNNAMYTVKGLPDNASAVTVGSTITVSYSTFPLPEDTFCFTLEGKDMELEPIRIVALPKAPPGLDAYADFIDMDGMKEGADDMISGADDMREGTDELLDALREMKDAAKKLQKGLDDLADGSGDIADGADAIHANMRTLKNSAAEFYAAMSEFTTNFGAFDAGMAALQQSVAGMAEDISDLNDAAGLVSTGVSGLDSGIDGLAGSNQALYEMAVALAGTYPEVSALAAGLSAQQGGIGVLAGNSGALKTLAAGVSANMDTFYMEFSTTFADSVAALRLGSAQLYAAGLSLLDGAYQISAACNSLSGALGSLSGGADGLFAGAAKAAAGVPELVDALGEMIGGVEELRSGMDALDEDGLKELKETLEGLDGYLSALADRAENYTSFMDTRNGGSVQFVLKTEGITLE
jgi:putative membrane protein